MLPRRALSLFAGCLAALCLPVGASAATLYVAPTGDDGADGTASRPLASVPKAVDRLAATGGTVRVADGSYPRLVLTKYQAERVTILGDGSARSLALAPRRLGARFAGGMLAGTSNLTVRGVAFDDTLSVMLHPVRKASQPSKNVALDRIEATGSTGNCVTVRGTLRVQLINSWIHDCFNAVGTSQDGSNGGTKTRGFQIVGNRMERLTGDGVDFSGSRKLSIVRNVIDDVSDPAGKVHNDGMQGIGDSVDTLIAGNTVSNVRSQLILLQGAVGTLDGMTVTNNLLHGVGGPGLMMSATRRARITNNTIWDTRYSALMVRKDDVYGDLGTDAVITNNILSAFTLLNAAPAVVANNVIGTTRATVDASNVIAPVPGFAAPGDFRLLADAPARGVASSRYAPSQDIRGVARAASPSAGAFE